MDEMDYLTYGVIGVVLLVGLILLTAVYKREDKDKNTPEKNRWALIAGSVLLPLGLVLASLKLFYSS